MNEEFKKKYPEIIIPPDFHLYETFGLNYERYYFGGLKTTSWILDSLGEYQSLKGKKILDWGCGPGRILRHLNALDVSLKVYGSDYNQDYVDWCNQNINKVQIKKNQLSPPLLFDSNFFDTIYSISIFTHLSLEMHSAWMKELNRICNKGAILLITTHGEASKARLNQVQKEEFDRGNLVVQSYKNEGNRLFAAYQPELFFRSLVEQNDFKILRHIEGRNLRGKIEQDTWIIRKFS